MASSNRHWPSLFKSKPHNQWQHDHVTSSHSSLLSPSPCQKPNSYSSSGLTGGEERSPDPKPRWNPKPEQIQILEAIFNSGMVNPPRDEIRRIRAQLQEYGQVGDANVFYWFQNRKSRSKNKLRSSSSSSSSSAAAAAARAHAQSRGGSSAALLPPPPMISLPPVTAPVTVGPTSSSSSSSERSTGGSDKSLPPPMVSTVVASSHSPTGSVNQTYLQSPSTTMTTELFVEPTGVYLQGSNQGFYVSSAAAAVAAAAAGELMPAGFWTELMMGQELWRSGGGVVHDLSNNNTCTNMQNPNPNGCGGVTGTATTAAAATSVAVTPGVAAHVNEIVQGELGCHEVVGGGGGAKSTVFINGVGFEVGLGPVNVREAFGEDAVLIHCSGHPVLTDDWGLTLQPLQHGASYYLV